MKRKRDTADTSDIDDERIVKKAKIDPLSVILKFTEEAGKIKYIHPRNINNQNEQSLDIKINEELDFLGSNPRMAQNDYVNCMSKLYYYSILADRLDIIDILVDKILDLSFFYVRGTNFLEFAAESGSVEAFDLIVKKSNYADYNKNVNFEYFDPNLPNVSPLLYASMKGRVDILNYMVGNDLLIHNENRRFPHKYCTVVQNAIDGNYLGFLEILLKNEIKTYKTQTYYTNSKDYEFIIQSDLYYAATSGNLEAVKILLEYEAPMIGYFDISKFALGRNQPIKSSRDMSKKLEEHIEYSIIDLMTNDYSRGKYISNDCKQVIFYLLGIMDKQEVIKHYASNNVFNCVITFINHLISNDNLQGYNLEEIEEHPVIVDSIIERFKSTLLNQGIKDGDFVTLLASIDQLSGTKISEKLNVITNGFFENLIMREAELLYNLGLVDGPVPLLSCIKISGFSINRDTFERYEDLYEGISMDIDYDGIMCVDVTYKSLVSKYFDNQNADNKNKLILFLEKNVGKLLLTRVSEEDYCTLAILGKIDESFLDNLVADSTTLLNIKQAINKVAQQEADPYYKVMQNLIVCQYQQIAQQNEKIEDLVKNNETRFQEIYAALNIHQEEDSSLIGDDELGADEC